MLKPLNRCLPLRNAALCPVFEGWRRGSCSRSGSRKRCVTAASHQLIHHCPNYTQSSCPGRARKTSEMIMDLRAAEGPQAKGPLLHPFGQISDQSTEQGHREPQSGDTPLTYCSVQSQQRHPLPQPPVLNIKASHRWLTTIAPCSCHVSTAILTSHTYIDWSPWCTLLIDTCKSASECYRLQNCLVRVRGG